MVNIGTSVIKRENKPADEVIRLLQQRGWSTTGTIGDRVTYLENSGINITIIDGAMGTVIIPSGPIRGRIFGENTGFFSNVSVIGAGSRIDSDMTQPQRETERNDNRTVF